MKRKQSSRNKLRSSSSEIGPDDGVDPRLFFRKKSESKSNRKALQLCGEVARTLSQVLAWELGDDLLSLLTVESVVPAPDSSRLLVTVSLPTAGGMAELDRVWQQLHLATGRLRVEIATAVQRRRVPELSFRVGIREEGSP